MNTITKKSLFSLKHTINFFQIFQVVHSLYESNNLESYSLNLIRVLIIILRMMIICQKRNSGISSTFVIYENLVFLKNLFCIPDIIDNLISILYLTYYLTKFKTNLIKWYFYYMRHSLFLLQIIVIKIISDELINNKVIIDLFLTFVFTVVFYNYFLKNKDEFDFMTKLLKELPVGIIIYKNDVLNKQPVFISNSIQKTLNLLNLKEQINDKLDENFKNFLGEKYNLTSHSSDDKINFCEKTLNDFIQDKNFSLEPETESFQNENEHLFVEKIDLKFENSNFGEEFRIISFFKTNTIIDNVVKMMKPKLILTISHELNNPLSGIIHSSHELVLAVTEKKREEKSKEIKQFAISIGMFIENLTLFLKFKFNEEFEMQNSFFNFNDQFLSIYNESEILFNLKQLVVRINNKILDKNLVVYYDLNLFNQLIKVIIISIYHNVKKNLLVNITIKEKNKIISVSIKSKEKSNGFYPVNDTDNYGINETVQTKEMIKENIINLCKILKIEFQFEHIVGIFQMKLGFNVNKIETIVEPERVYEMSPYSNSMKKSNINKLDSKYNRSNFKSVHVLKNKFQNSTQKNLDVIVEEGRNIRFSRQYGRQNSLQISNFSTKCNEIFDFVQRQELVKIKKQTSNQEIFNDLNDEDDTPSCNFLENLNFAGLSKLVDSHQTERDSLNKTLSRRDSEKRRSMTNKEQDKDFIDYFEMDYKVRTVRRNFSSLMGTNIFEKLVEREKEKKLQNDCKCKDILIVDDDDILRKSYLSILKQLNLEAEIACDGSELVSRLKKESRKSCCLIEIKLVLLDIYMLPMNGLEAVREINDLVIKNDIRKVPKIVLVSAHDSSNIKEILKELKIIRKFEKKPLTKQKLKEILNVYYYEAGSLSHSESEN